VLYRRAQAGSLESGDVMVRVAPSDGDTVTVLIESKVSQRFSSSIQNTVREVAADLGVSGVRCELIDRGALDFVIRARVATALRRAMEEVDTNG